MKEKQFSLIETLLIECLFFFAFFGVLKYFNIGNSRFFFLSAFVLLVAYFFIGTARYIEMMRNEEPDRKTPK